MGKKSGSGFGRNNPDHISESFETIFWVKILKFFKSDPESGIQDEKNSDPDPQHWVPLPYSTYFHMHTFKELEKRSFRPARFFKI
jgi:hypothetical protein